MAFTSKLGTKFLFVAGTCKFWANDFAWAGTRSGTLSSEQATWVEREMHYAELARLEGQWLPDECYDAPTLTVTAGTSTLSCVCGCNRPSTPGAVRDIDEAFPTVVAQLAELGALWGGPLRLFLVEDQTLSDQSLLPWPLQRPVKEFTLDSSVLHLEPKNEGSEIVGFLVDSPEEVSQLRDTIATHVNTKGPLRADDPLPITADGTVYALYARDELAF
jgi:hypothetical protein